MEDIKIRDFLNNGYGSGDSDGSGSGYGDGYGDSDGSGYGSGDGDGSGYGDGSGSGYGYVYGDVKKYNQHEIHMIDGLETVITKIKGNVAKGYLLKKDLRLEPCYIVKGGGFFSHGETLKKANEALQEKIIENMDTEETIEAFLKVFDVPNKKYPAKDFYKWHHILTGSCEMGRAAFVKNGGYDLEHDKFTVWEFIEITQNSYGGEIVKQIGETLEERENEKTNHGGGGGDDSHCSNGNGGC